jgi:short chain dehydrogenase
VAQEALYERIILEILYVAGDAWISAVEGVCEKNNFSAASMLSLFLLPLFLYIIAKALGWDILIARKLRVKQQPDEYQQLQKRYENKICVITGASSGLGEGLALHYASYGVKLVIAARRVDALKELEERCLLRGAKGVLSVACDVSKQQDCQRLIQATLDKYQTNRIDLLFLCAGVGLIQNFAEVSTSDELQNYHTLMDTNFFGCLYPTHYALPYLKNAHG